MPEKALVDTLAAEVEAETVGDTLRCAGTCRHAADLQAEVEAETLAMTEVETETRMHWSTLADSCRGRDAR